jgi:hypothetical protein
MNKVGIDKFYDRHRGYVNVTAGYLSEKRIPFILKSCRLRPYASLSAPLPTTPQLERWWVDEFGNSFMVGKNKRVSLRYGDLKIERSKLQTTDLYANVSIRDLYTISRFLYICVAEFDVVRDALVQTIPSPVTSGNGQGNNLIYILSFLGRDNFFRTRLLYRDQEDKISTLYLGYKLLKMIATYTDIRYYHKLTARSILPNLPLVNVRQWVSFLPSHTKLASEIESECPLATKIIGLEK